MEDADFEAFSKLYTGTITHEPDVLVRRISICDTGITNAKASMEHLRSIYHDAVFSVSENARMFQRDLNRYEKLKALYVKALEIRNTFNNSKTTAEHGEKEHGKE